VILIYRLRSLFRWVFRRQETEQELSNELQDFIERSTAEKVVDGMPPEEARRLAGIELGGVAQVQEQVRATRGLPWLDGFGLDVKLGLRMLRKSWGLTLIGGLAMAVVIAIAAGALSVMDTVEGSTLRLDEGERVVAIQPFDVAGRGERDTSLEDFARWREHLRSVEGIGAYRTLVNLYLVIPSGPVGTVRIAEMTASAFGLARVQPLLGRLLTEDDERAGAEPVIVIAYDVWQSRFSSDPAVLGQRIQLEGTFRTVVGVMPEGFAFPVNHRFWTPLSTDPLDYPRGAAPEVFVIARLTPGVTLERAAGEVATLGLLPSAAWPGITEELQTRVVPYAYTFTDEFRDDRWQYRLSLVAIALLLVLPCANIAILLYARNVTRQQEFAARYVLGASRGRIVVQLLVESLVFAGAAGGVALLAAREGLGRLRSLVDQELGSTIPYWMDFRLSFQTVLFVAALVALAAMLAGVVPALWATGRWRQSGLHALGATTGLQLGKTWTALVVAQVALATAVLPVVGEFAWLDRRSDILGSGIDFGEFLTANLTMGGETLPGTEADPREFVSRFGAFQAELVRQLAAGPGVFGATVSRMGPGSNRRATIEVDEVNGVRPEPFTASYNQVDAFFFEVFGFRRLTGRGFEREDFETGRTAVIVNQTFVEDMMGEQNPLGRRIRYITGGPRPESDLSYEIVGVVNDVPANTGRRRVYHAMVPGETQPVRLSLHVGPTIEPGVAYRLWETTAALDPSLRIHVLRSLGRSTSPRRFIYETQQFLIETVMPIGVLLFAVAGIHTLMALTVAGRRREVGIRSALGAEPRRLVADIFRRALRPVAAGIVGGALVACLIDSVLFVVIDDMAVGRVFVIALTASAAGMIVVASLASAGPARRALRVDPAEALRDG
jgi:predicted permease